jgi:hypothetical protein
MERYHIYTILLMHEMTSPNGLMLLVYRDCIPIGRVNCWAEA